MCSTCLHDTQGSDTTEGGIFFLNDRNATPPVYATKHVSEDTGRRSSTCLGRLCYLMSFSKVHEGDGASSPSSYDPPPVFCCK